ncbi:MAG TPA: TonB family protein [Vicinamibacterales bacterium]
MTEIALTNLAAWSVQVALLTFAVAIATRFFAVDLPPARYAVWRVVLIASLVLPLIQPWHPRTLSGDETTVPEIPLQVPAFAPSNTVEPASMSVTVLPAGERWPAFIVFVLAAGAVLRIGWVAGGLIRLRRIRRRGVPATESAAPDLLQSLIDAGADVRYVPSMRQPVTFGMRPSVVLLPSALQTMSPGVQQAVLAHELWHVRRRDWLWSLCEELLCAIFWFHPAIWYLVARVQGAREEIVDRLSVRSTNARRCYLEALLAFADEPAVYPAAPFIRRRQLFHRMMLISKEGVMSHKRIVASSLAMAGALVLTGWYGVLAFPLTASTTPSPDGQAQAQPRDPRPHVARPATSREQELKTTIAADPTHVANWFELAKLQEERGAIQEAEATLRSAFTATGREVMLSQARFYARHGDFQQSIDLVETYAAQNPTDPSGHQLVATWYWEKAQKDATLSPADKLMYIESGIRATDRALAQRPDYIEALTYKNILLRMKGNLQTDPASREQLFNEANALRNRAIELNKARTSVQRPAGSVPPPPPPPPPGYYEVDGQQAVRVGGQVRTPAKIRDVRPVYPQDAQDARISGVVIIEALIDTQGNVRSARVLRSIPGLDEAALAAVKQWQFTPTVLDGVAVPLVMTVTVNFTLQ